MIILSPRDEYEYERERFRSNGMLLSLMIAERPPAASVAGAIQADREAAEALDTRAGEEAARGEFEAAVKTEEQAIAYLVRALRRAGLYVTQ